MSHRYGPDRVALHPHGIRLPYVNASAAVLDELDGIRWRERGSCSGTPHVGWFEDTRAPAAQRARSICAGCPVRRKCLAAALLYGEEYGIWGGLDPDERLPLDDVLRDGAPLGRVVDAALHTDRVA
ncbi:WhiB family transcriptional regulator [Phycicoccus flavus]|uniref:WhiB family transcriptional regulator n=1 Tax=Phycicoccus flavus TaxID=2502783 RepID=UPI000FEB85A7|nr:WhiB family transcriptional regulator [Phycicoccus flavus]NHA67478.1 WhiB family transcriptional regulator [Phycicoccus flavus]